MHRVIPVLSLSKGDLVKTVRFKNERYLGDPINALKIFNEKEVDEIYIQDIKASVSGAEPDFGLIAELASEAFMPLSYGGGVSSIQQIERLLKCGIEKVSLNTAVASNPELISQATKVFGAQAIIVALDIKRNFFNRTRIKNYSSKYNLGDILNFLVNNGVGEVIINSIDRDGTMTGVDTELITYCAERLDIPFTYVGGVSSIEDIRDSKQAGASGTGVGSFFVYNGPKKAMLISYQNIED